MLASAVCALHDVAFVLVNTPLFDAINVDPVQIIEGPVDHDPGATYPIVHVAPSVLYNIPPELPTTYFVMEDAYTKE